VDGKQRLVIHGRRRRVHQLRQGTRSIPGMDR